MTAEIALRRLKVSRPSGLTRLGRPGPKVENRLKPWAIVKCPSGTAKLSIRGPEIIPIRGRQIIPNHRRQIFPVRGRQIIPIRGRPIFPVRSPEIFHWTSPNCPEGTADNSPTFQRWVSCTRRLVPKGRLIGVIHTNARDTLLSRPFGTYPFLRPHPRLKPWAIVRYPFGMTPSY